jgi:hypothetical protein
LRRFFFAKRLCCAYVGNEHSCGPAGPLPLFTPTISLELIHLTEMFRQSFLSLSVSLTPSRCLTSSSELTVPHRLPTMPHCTPPYAPPCPPCHGRRQEALGVGARHGDPRRGSAGTDKPWCSNSNATMSWIQWHGGPDEVGPRLPRSRVPVSFSPLSLSLPTPIQCREANGTVGRWCGCVGHHGEDGAVVWRQLAASSGTTMRRRRGGEIVGFASSPTRRSSTASRPKAFASAHEFGDGEVLHCPYCYDY